ncbi:uncharacterized protein LOC62_07G009358 [Vanrija pseudolonga]|uniref:Uncharacterized protein n=1 Tax=Vanrija pseudolonga TaxID=143232 RepID=A0AAF0YFL5_9TREE|nr:hypothetical protein LOC62_07G009358 [Vanrija pseudolonga]
MDWRRLLLDTLDYAQLVIFGAYFFYTPPTPAPTHTPGMCRWDDCVAHAVTADPNPALCATHLAAWDRGSRPGLYRS